MNKNKVLELRDVPSDHREFCGCNMFWSNPLCVADAKRRIKRNKKQAK